MPLVPLRELPVDSAVAPGRLGYDQTAPTLLLHGFLAPAAWDELASKGVLRARAEHVETEALDAFAYSWMARMVRERLGAEEDAWPLWLWARTTRLELVRAARRYARLAPGTVLVTVRMAREQVLLSGFDDWHSALNGQPVWAPSLTDDEHEAALDGWYHHLDAELPGHGAIPRHDWPAALQDELVTSWPELFDPARWTRRSHVQACAAELRATVVVDAVRLAERPGLPTVAALT